MSFLLSLLSLRRWARLKGAGQGHLDHIVSEFTQFYNESRPHQRMENRPLTGSWSDIDEPLSQEEMITCKTWLGGVLKHYERTAA
jgi:hypothetical protein